MALALPGARGLLIHMQKFLFHVNGKRVTMTQGVHDTLSDFCWLADDVSKRPARLYKLSPSLPPTKYGYHDTKGIID